MKMTQKVQLEAADLEFIDRVCVLLGYRSKSEYIRTAIRERIRADKRRLRERERQTAMEGYSEGHEDVFESIAAKPFQDW